MNDQLTAKSRYEEYKEAIADLQKKLADGIESHHVEFETSGGRDWGYPGDLAHVYELLQQAADFMNIPTLE